MSLWLRELVNRSIGIHREQIADVADRVVSLTHLDVSPFRFQGLPDGRASYHMYVHLCEA